MYISGKLTHSTLLFMAQRNIDLEDMVSKCFSSSSEFVRDSNFWLDAHEVELFLSKVNNRVSSFFPQTDWVKDMGHSCHHLKAWGVLDSVMRMMQQPSDFYREPQRFLSYFISPEVHLFSVKRDEDFISFSIKGFCSYEYPFITAYLKSVLEALPIFVGRNPVEVSWEAQEVCICWGEAQQNLWSESGNTQLNPELINTTMRELEEAQQKLEKTNRQLLLKAEELRQLKTRLSPSKSAKIQEESWSVFETTLQDMGHTVFTLNDYFVRAQQLISLLADQKSNFKMQTAFQRVHWDQVKKDRLDVYDQFLNRWQNLRGLVSSLKEGVDA